MAKKKRNPQDATVGRNIGALKKRLVLFEQELDATVAKVENLEQRIIGLEAKVAPAGVESN